MQELTQVVSTVGFPIVFCLLMWKYISSQNEQTHQVITEFTATMREFKVTMNENNRIMTAIADKLNVYVEANNNGN